MMSTTPRLEDVGDATGPPTSSTRKEEGFLPDETTALLLSSSRRRAHYRGDQNIEGPDDDASPKTKTLNTKKEGIGNTDGIKPSQKSPPRVTFETNTMDDDDDEEEEDQEEEDFNSQMKPSAGESAAVEIRRKFRAFKRKMTMGEDFDSGSEEDEETLGKGSNGMNGMTNKGSSSTKKNKEKRDENNADENGEKNVSTAYAQKIIDRETKWLYIKCTCLATSWFLLSASLALYNKAIFSKKGFPAPLLYTSCQFFMQWVLANAGLQWPALFNEQDKRFVTRGRPIIPTDSWMRTIAPVGFFMGLDIGLSNISLVYITVSFYTLTKTTSLIFTLFVSFITGIEKFSWTLTGIVVTVMLGEAAAVIGETQFNAIGFLICLSAAAVSAIRWVVAQKVMHSPSSNKYGLHHPVILLYHAMPVMTVVTFSFSCVHEQWWKEEKWDQKQWTFHTPTEWLMAFATVLFGACMAFGMTLSEFELLKTTSAITVMIIGTAKDLITIGASVVIYGDVLDVYNVCGLFLCLMGIIGYNNYKLQKMKKEALTGKTGDIDDGLPLPVVVSKSSDYKEEHDDIFRQTFAR